jgi:hypothetical protein
MTKKKSFIRLSPVGGSDVRVGVTSLTGESQTNLKKKEKQKLMKIVATPSVCPSVRPARIPAEHGACLW